jgi:hypothetical protein
MVRSRIAVWSQLSRANNQKLTDADALTAWAKEKSKDWTIYNDRWRGPARPMAYNSPHPFEVLTSPKRSRCCAFHEVAAST